MIRFESGEIGTLCVIELTELEVKIAEVVAREGIVCKLRACLKLLHSLFEAALFHVHVAEVRVSRHIVGRERFGVKEFLFGFSEAALALAENAEPVMRIADGWSERRGEIEIVLGGWPVLIDHGRHS